MAKSIKSRSEKTPVIDKLYDIVSAKGQSVAYMADVRDAIQQSGAKLKDDNLANFMKDIVRSKNAGDIWPDRLKRLRIGGRQKVGDGRVLEFVPYAAVQTEPFESSFKPNTASDPIPIQSISLPLPARSLGRKDESWLIQVVVGLKIIETHFATRVRREPLNIVEINHLQIGVKLGGSEIDSLFLASVENTDGTRSHALLTCEAKQENERILEDQIVQQVVAANKSIKSAGLKIELIIPMAIQALSSPIGSIYIAEFDYWTPEQAEVDEDSLGMLDLVAEGVYQLRPPVPGIGYRKPKPRNTRELVAADVCEEDTTPQRSEPLQSPADAVS